MFSTLKFNNHNSDKKLVNLTHSNSHKFVARSRHSACRACQSKKLRCSGEKSGCDRCLSKAITCLYAVPKKKPEVLHAAHTCDVLHGIATHRIGPSESATAATNTTYPGHVKVSLPTRYQHDETLSGQNLLQELQAAQAEDLDAKGHIRCDNYSNYFEEDGALGQDATFDEIWNVCSGVANKEPIVGSHHVVESRFAPFKDYFDPEDQPPLVSLNMMDPRELIGFDHRPIPGRRDSFRAHASLDFSTAEAFAPSNNTSDWSDFSNLGSPEHQSPSGVSPRIRLLEHQPHQSSEIIDLPSTAKSKSRTQAGPTSSSCRCVKTALQVLELLENSNNKLTVTAIDHVLAIQKNAISQLLPILQCRACKAAPGFVLQLIVICEKILITFESFTTGFHGWRPRPVGYYNHGDPDKSKMGDTQKFILGVCEVDSEHEQRILLTSLAIVQLQNFHRVLIKLEENVVSREWEMHQSPLTSLIQRSQDTAIKLRVRESMHLG